MYPDTDLGSLTKWNIQEAGSYRITIDQLKETISIVNNKQVFKMKKIIYLVKVFLCLACSDDHESNPQNGGIGQCDRSNSGDIGTYAWN